MNKFIDSHGYVMVYMREHHRAKQNGYVAEHILVAEEMLGRELKPLEVVHHEDRKRDNNSPNNLFVFATKEDHVRYHNNGIMLKVEDYYISPDTRPTGKCEICEKQFLYYERKQTGNYCSHDCYSKSMQVTERPSKEELLELIKSKSFLQIGKDFGVSDNAIRKWCKSYGLPTTLKGVKSLKQ